jgi:hypothetical protein
VKKTLTIFLLFIISIQCLPVKELGKCLFDNTFVEEECCKGDVKKQMADIKDLLFYSMPESPAVEPQSFFAIHNTELHDSPAADVTTPPPNA